VIIETKGQDLADQLSSVDRSRLDVKSMNELNNHLKTDGQPD